MGLCQVIILYIGILLTVKSSYLISVYVCNLMLIKYYFKIAKGQATYTQAPNQLTEIDTFMSGPSLSLILESRKVYFF